MTLPRFAALLSLLTIAGCAYFPSGMPQRVQSEVPQAPRTSQQASAGARPPVYYKAEPGAVDPKLAPYAIRGITYWPIQSGLGYREDGLASWYGIDFHGKKTATGETYDMFSVSAAHKTLPLGTTVRVTNLENGRQLELVVNDRGPFVDGRIIDLSYASARLLGMADNGVAKVRVEGIGENPVLARGGVKTLAVASADSPPKRPKQQFIERNIVEEPAKQQSAPVLAQGSTERMAQRASLSPQRAPEPRAEYAAKAEAGRYSVQVGAFSQDDNARRVQAQLVQSGFGQARITRVVRGGKELLAVQAGAFERREKAEEALRSLKPQFPASFISSGA